MKDIYKNIMGCLCLTIIIIITFQIYHMKDTYGLKCIISTKDGKRYCVRDRKNIDGAVELLRKVINKCKLLISKLKEEYPYDKRVIMLEKNFRPDKVYETLPTSELTAYSENKGEKMAVCLNKTKNDNTKLIDEHTLTFVCIHEMSHMMTTSIGHKEDFWMNFKFLLIQAKKYGIHEPSNYKKKNEDYCGISIKDNPYYDL
jgi:hypothetical protein